MTAESQLVIKKDLKKFDVLLVITKRWYHPDNIVSIEPCGSLQILVITLDGSHRTHDYDEQDHRDMDLERILNDWATMKKPPNIITDQSLASAALDLLQGDPHQWSTRPCTTCQTISTLTKRAFGCVLYRQRNPT